MHPEEKRDFSYKRRKIRMIVDFSLETVHART